MTVVELPSKSVRDYLAQFGAVPIYVTRTCKVGVGRDLARVGAVAVLWARDRSTAEQIVMALGEAHPGTVEQAIAEIRSAAGRLGIVLSEHAVVLSRAKAAAGKIDAKLRRRQPTE
jgi:hypothetical protein